MPLKPDGQPYKTVTGKTEVSGFWAKADGAITLKVHTVKAPGPLFVLDDFIYPGDFLISLKADGAGWGFLNTELFQ